MNKNSKWLKTVTATSMMSVFIISSMIPTVVQGSQLSTAKEEVVYVNLDSNGDLIGTYVVNIFNDSDIVDYGNYSEVRNMNTNDEIKYDSGVVNIKNSKDKLYYEGVIENAEIPWDIDITYKMDGKEYSAKDIAGRSGKLTMEIKISENKKATEGFFDNYALQATVQLDGKKCKNIKSDDATVANVGELKQLTYTIMPGNEKDINITADVKDFEVGNIAINGVKLNLGINKDSIDTSNLTSEIEKLQSAVKEVDNGANNLNNGAGKLESGAIKLDDGIETINEALKTLNGKSSSLNEGSSEVKSALQTIETSLSKVNTSSEELTKLSAASGQIKDGISKLVTGLETVDNSITDYYNGLSAAGLKDTNEFVNNHNNAIAALAITNTQRSLYEAYIASGINGVQSQVATLAASGDKEAIELLNKYTAGDTNAIVDYITNAGKIISIETLLKADISYIQGSNKLISGIDAALDKESGELMKGANALKANYEIFDKSIQNLVASLSDLMVNMNQLKNGISLLNENYSALDSGTKEYTNAVNTITLGYQSICAGANELVKGTSELYSGTKTMVSGTGEFVEETNGLQSNVDNEIDSMLKNFTGSDSEIKSFVCDKNTNVNSVQFVIQAEGVEKETVEVEESKETEKLNIWQKFLRLFKL
ncbi:hypothetical protein CM240_1761 [Clostridium bornimense]|uniref:Uncharacterized protein n=1 Tax=Clostridium bornimense TaxID=1216932 RepID=W6RZA3_9CLOT|nr:hypothetical protein [Clostridium bornimense]CDM68919.1 hypothetical protein CM240_1761 [Clostridium bornimense]